MGNGYAGTGASREIRQVPERQLTLELIGDSKILTVSEDGHRRHRIEVLANSGTIRVGCTSITRKAWEYIVQEVARQS